MLYIHNFVFLQENSAQSDDDGTMQCQHPLNVSLV